MYLACCPIKIIHSSFCTFGIFYFVTVIAPGLNLEIGAVQEHPWNSHTPDPNYLLNFSGGWSKLRLINPRKIKLNSRAGAHRKSWRKTKAYTAEIHVLVVRIDFTSYVCSLFLQHHYQFKLVWLHCFKSQAKI